MVIRTITTDWLKRNGACDGGIALFRKLNGDRVTMVFNAKDLNWIRTAKLNSVEVEYENVYGHNVSKVVHHSEYYNYVIWLFRKIACKSPELLQDLADNGIDLDAAAFWVESPEIKVPVGYYIWRGDSGNYWLQRINNQLWIVGM